MKALIPFTPVMHTINTYSMYSPVQYHLPRHKTRMDKFLSTNCTQYCTFCSA